MPNTSTALNRSVSSFGLDVLPVHDYTTLAQKDKSTQTCPQWQCRSLEDAVRSSPSNAAYFCSLKSYFGGVFSPIGMA